MAQKNYVSKSPESTRMFDHPIMEALSKVHYSVPLIIFVPTICFLLLNGFMSQSLDLLTVFAWIFFGLCIWTLTEYMLHRYIFHFHPSSDWGKKIQFIFHGVHHDYPQDRLRLVMPPAISLPLATLFYFFFSFFVQGDALFPFFGGFLLGYLIYDMIHYATHHLEVKGRFWNVLKTHHMKHHYMNPDRGYGVSSPVWDYIVGSGYASPEKKSKDIPSP